MNSMKSQFNDKIRFPMVGVYNTHFPTRVYKKLECASKNDISSFFSKKNSWNLDEIVTTIPHREAVATLIIPPGSTIVRSRDSFGEMRTDKVYVEKIEILGNDDSHADDYVCESPTYGDTIYKVGDIIEPEFPLDTDILKTCTSGIHFFPLKEQAENYKCPNNILIF
ncbi:hypothetical protein [Acanthamoeba polyphaga mimivirus]|uniref:Uncharacterized protein n=2 Tax=Megamimivirinae TaxID=3044648 RepID=A0A2L2DKW7_MIMIV|nr:hypothetical protein LBA_01152 [Megavirus lba]AVG46811.1 hypothetical protein [Acanthamoeba polyphaga mimivirus]